MKFIQSAGTIIATMFFMREDARKEDRLPFDAIRLFALDYCVAFKDINAEMFFTAELSHKRYYKVGDFDRLCYKCFDFSNIIQKEPVMDMSRQVNRIKSIGTPLWAKGLGTMSSKLDAWRIRRDYQ